MESLNSLWTEVVQESGSVEDPLFYELVENTEFNWLFEGASQDKLKTVLGLTNRLLNSPKSKAKGLAVISKFVTILDNSFLVHQKEAITSSLHLLTKCLDFDLAHNILANLLPKCHNVSELNQVITSSIVPKILTFFCENTSIHELPSKEGFASLTACIMNYHGPCGQYRGQLESILIPLLEVDNSETLNQIVQVIPLLSRCGGIGKGDKHTVDWTDMVLKTLHTMFDTLEELYETALQDQHIINFNSGQVSFESYLQPIQDRNILYRITMLKRRLVNFSYLLRSYFRVDFSSPKNVPQKSIIDLIINMTSVDPSDILLRNQRGVVKEKAFLASVVPSVQMAAFNILEDLITCVGTNLFVEGGRIENIIMLVLAYIKRDPRSFELMRIQIYKTVITWMKLTNGSLVNSKTCTTLIDHIKRDILVEKRKTGLNLSSLVFTQSKSKNSKKSQKQVKAKEVGLENDPTANTNVCQLALELLLNLIPNLDPVSHMAIYEILVHTSSDIFRTESIPIPYDNPENRLNCLKCIEELARSPNPNSSISLSLLIDIAQKATRDSDVHVSFCSHRILYMLERIIHPICQSLSFPSISASRENKSRDSQMNKDLEKGEEMEISDDENNIETNDNSCQTDDNNLLIQSDSSSSGKNSAMAIMDKSKMKEIIQEVFQEMPQFRNNMEIANKSTTAKQLFMSERKKSLLDVESGGIKYPVNGNDERKKRYFDDGDNESNEDMRQPKDNIEHQQLSLEPTPSASLVSTTTSNNPVSSSTKRFKQNLNENENKNEEDEAAEKYQIKLDKMLLDFVDVPLVVENPVNSKNSLNEN